MRFTLEHQIIPDGTDSVVLLTIKTEFTVPSEGGMRLAEEVIAEVAARLARKSLEQVRAELSTQSLQHFWTSDIERPDEASPP